VKFLRRRLKEGRPTLPAGPGKKDPKSSPVTVKQREQVD
jgi:hypothetical protein